MHRALLLSLVSLFAFTAPSLAHYHMLLPNTASAKKDDAVTFTYQWGHPFEHQLFDAPPPESVEVIAPDGKKSDLTKSLEKIALPTGDKQVTAYRFTFTPNQRGDYVFLLRTAPIWMQEESEFYQDTVKVVLHVQAQKGWNHAYGNVFEWSPMTRPYGLEPGMVFQAEVLGARGRRLVEVERYNDNPPK